MRRLDRVLVAPGCGTLVSVLSMDTRSLTRPPQRVQKRSTPGVNVVPHCSQAPAPVAGRMREPQLAQNGLVGSTAFAQRGHVAGASEIRVAGTMDAAACARAAGDEPGEAGTGLLLYDCCCD
jgi:hypothetical protein